MTCPFFLPFLLSPFFLLCPFFLLNRSYQFEIHCLLRGLYLEYSLSYDLLREMDLTARVDEVLS